MAVTVFGRAVTLEREIRKRSHEKCTKSKKKSKEIKSDNFMYCKVVRAINTWVAIEESPTNSLLGIIE